MRTTPARDEFREVMDIRLASDYLGISPDTLYKYASDGFVPAFKLGNRWRFKRSRLDGWMDQQSSQGALPRKTEAQPVVSQPRKPQSQAVVSRQKRAVGGSR
jgi:excisionase family DNA binding protein